MTVPYKMEDDEVIEYAEEVEEELPKKTSIAVKPQSNDIVIHKGNTGAIIQVRSKVITVAGEKHKVDPYQVIRMIKRITQNIGEYKAVGDLYSTVITGALRKARGDLVGVLEKDFNIHWQINQDTGESIFFM